MQSLNEILVQKKIKEIRFKAIASIVCGFLSIIPYLGVLFNLANWILFFILLYDLKIYGGAKNLFKNFFIATGISFFGTLVSTSSLFVILKPRIDFFGNFYFNQDSIFSAITTFSVLFIITLALIFPFLKAFYYEIARATKQKYFIYAFNTFYLGLLTLIIGIGLVFLLASLIFWIFAWIKFEELDKQEFSHSQEMAAKTQKKVFDFDLKWIKITMALFLVLSFVIFGLKFTQRIIFQSIRRGFFYFEDYDKLIYNLVDIRYVLVHIATFLALLSVFLFCKKLKTYKMFIYFLIWQVLVIFGWNLRFILKLIMGEDVFIENFILDKIISVAYIIIAFFFFKTLVQATKEKLFYLVFAFFVCGEIVSKLFFAFIRLLDSIRLQATIVDIIYIGIPFTPAYFISFLIVWLSLKGQKEVKKAI
ncbi:hypothetical protein FXR79_05195 [Campylobacter coli]|nr:hypothetical protein [Campylobacter coli]